jgi:hypothetical protein
MKESNTPDARKPSAWLPETEAEREAIREELGHILASSHFCNSKRSASLLRCTVEYALNGKAEPAKERTLGVEVFGREPNYDTAQDPVVRMTGVEIRKRLAQYYQDGPGHKHDEHKVRIDFPPGSYVPEFRPPTQAAPRAAESQPAESAATTRWPWRLMAALIVGIALIFVLVWWRPWVSETALDRFWKPVLSSPSPVLLCIGDERVLEPDPNAPVQPPSGSVISGETTVRDVLRHNVVRYAIAQPLFMLTGFLGTKNKKYRVRHTGATTLEDLRDGPVILIGLADNAWTLRLGGQLRFTLADEGGRLFIEDRQNPSNRAWGYDGLHTPLAKVPESQGIISRVMDPTTGQFVVMAAGLLWGTAAAGECLITSSCFEEAAKLAPGDWKHKNIQIVVAAKVIAENSGTPRVLAAYVW